MLRKFDILFCSFPKEAFRVNLSYFPALLRVEVSSIRVKRVSVDARTARAIRLLLENGRAEHVAV